MTNNHTNSTPGASGEERRLSLAAMLRAAADGELTAREQADLDRHLAANPEDRSRIEFERGLRSSCARVMGRESEAGCAPERLRALVQQHVAASRAGSQSPPAITPALDASNGVAGRIHSAGRVHGGAGAGRSRNVRRIAGLVGMAAAIPLFIAGWLYFEGSEEGAMAAVPVKYLSDEHTVWETGKPPTDRIKATDALRNLVNTRVSVEDIENAGFKFVASGPARLPGGSMHLLFSRPAGAEGQGTGVVHLSLFIQKASGSPRLTQGITWSTRCGEHAPSTATPAGKPYVLAWQKDDLVYFLVTECPMSGDLARQGLRGPDTSGSL